MPESVALTGIDEVKDYLRDLPRAVVRDLFPDALAAGGAAMEKEVRDRTPRADTETTSAKEYGRLVDDISTSIHTEELSGSALTGFDKTGFVAVFVEYGHRSADGKFTPAHPFIRPAAEAAEDSAVNAFFESLATNIK